MKVAAMSMGLLALCCMARASYAFSDADCASGWAAADAKKSGVLLEADAPRIFGALHFANKTVDPKGLSRDQYLAYCKDGVFDMTPASAGAPLKGANSFTEAQAKSRAAAYGYVVTAMTKDADGIWRGTVDKDGQSVSVAVDFKGNVVSN